MAYTPPGWSAADIELLSGAYTPPGWSAADIEFIDVAFSTIQPSGFAGTAFGAPSLLRVITPGAYDAGAIGEHSVYNLLQVVVPTGLAPGGIGTHTIYNEDQFTYPSGFSAGAMGAPANVYNKTQTLQVTGLNAGSIPLVHRVEHSIRTLAPASIAQTAFGTHDLAGGIRWIDHAGRGTGPQTFGVTFVAPAVRFMYPVGIHALMWGAPIVDQTHYVDGIGFEAIEWGVSWIHDNKQYAESVGNFHAITWGMPEVTRSPRELAPTGFSLRDILPNERWGRPDVWNLRQYVTHYHDIEPDEGGVFGSPLHMTIENRNRTLGAVGFIATKIPNSLVIDNTGRALVHAGWDSATFGFHHDGLGFIAYAIRTVTPTDVIGPERFSNWNAVIKTPQFFPVGIAPMGMGTPHLERGPEFHPPGFGGEVFGTAFIAPRVRTLAQYFAYEGRVPEPDVQLWERYVAPPGIPPREVGAHTLEHHRNQFFPRWNWQHDLMGTEVVVRNVTPELYQHGAVQTEWGSAEIRWNPYPLRPPGLPALAWGGNTIEHREKYLGVYGIEGTRWGPNTQIRNDQPDPPWTRTFALTGFTQAVVPSPVVRRNEIEPPGFDAALYGRPTVALMGCYPSGWVSMVFGATTQVSGPQYVTTVGLKPPDVSGLDGGFPTPRISPFTIYCRPDAPEGYTAPGYWERMDTHLEEGNMGGARPFFGHHAVSNQYRTVYATGGYFNGFGVGSVELQHRRITLDGFKAGRIGFPMVPFTEEAFAWPIDPTLTFGTAYVENRNRILSVSGASGFAASTGARVEFLNRDVAPPGWDSFTMSIPVPYDRRYFGPLSNRIHYPEPIVAGGEVLGLWGDNWVSHRIRTVQPTGWEEFVSDYTWEEFDERMRVRVRGRLTPASMGALLGFGVPFIDQSVRGIAAGNIRAGWMGSPEVRFIGKVVPSGWDSSAFGDVQQWEAGKVKPHGDELALYGNYGKVSRGVHAVGFDASGFGTPRRGDALDPAGFDNEAWGSNTITHGDAMEYTCGGFPRGIPPAGFALEAWGTAEVTHG